MSKRRLKISIVGTVGLPAKYGGFETLIENLVREEGEFFGSHTLTVYCSGKQYEKKLNSFGAANLNYIPLEANGIQSVLYDFVCLLHSVIRLKADVILILGVSGTMILPFIRLISHAKIITNIDGMEWKREKWNTVAKLFLKVSERIAVKYSHSVISDNQAISEYVCAEYNVQSDVIAYGGDHVILEEAVAYEQYGLPELYFFTVCRIEKENNIDMILEAFSRDNMPNLVMVGNWNYSEFGKHLFQQHSANANIFLLDPIYNLGVLRGMRENSQGFVHGHSAGGTNPSLVEAMWFGKPIFAFDCNYNRYTTKNSAKYFKSATSLAAVIGKKNADADVIGENMISIAKAEYKWSHITSRYVRLINHS